METIFKPISKEEWKKRFIEIITKQGAYENSDGTWSCDNDINISDMNLLEIPVQFKEVKGNFKCFKNKLSSLKGSPKIVGKDLNCSYNQLNSLKYCPKIVGRHFDCSWNKLSNLRYKPVVKGYFLSYKNDILTVGRTEKIIKELIDVFER